MKHKLISKISLFGLALAMIFAVMPVPSNARIKTYSSLWSGYREPLSLGVENTLFNALNMYNTFWMPLSDVSVFGTTVETNRKFVAGHTYRGIPYGQPDNNGSYVGSGLTIGKYKAAVEDPENPFYTERGETRAYTDQNGRVMYSPYLSNDSGGFVSAALHIDRRTPADIGADSDLFPVIGQKLSQLRPGDLLNSVELDHVILVYDVVYDHKGGKIQSIVTIEQTPDIIVMRSFGKGGIYGSLSDLQDKIYTGKYYIHRYTDFDNVGTQPHDDFDTPMMVYCICEPVSVFSYNHSAVGNAYVSFSEDSFRLEGWAIINQYWIGEVKGFEYLIYDSLGTEKEEYTIHKLNAEYCDDLDAPVFGFDYIPTDYRGKVNYFSGNVPLDGVVPGDLIDVYAVNGNGEKRVIATLTIREKPSSHTFESSVESIETECGEENVRRATLTKVDTLPIKGWCAADGLIRFELKIDDGLWYQLSPEFREDVWDQTSQQYSNCRDCNAFNCSIDFSSLPGNTHNVTLRAVLEDGGTFTVLECSCSKTPPAVIALVIAGSSVLLCGVAVIVFFIVKRKKKPTPETGETITN